MHSGSTNEIAKISIGSFLVGSTALRHRKLELYVQEAIQSAGRFPALVMSMDQVETVEAGKRADLIFIRGRSAWRCTQHREIWVRHQKRNCVSLCRIVEEPGI